MPTASRIPMAISRPDEVSRPPTRRKPLGDATFRANIASSPVPSVKPGVSPSDLPHNEFLDPHGTLTVRNGTESPAPTPTPTPAPTNQRRSVIASLQNQSNRNSAVSTATTGSGNARKRKSYIGPWHLGPGIGEGGCSRVRMVKNKETGQLAAAKIITKSAAEKVRAESLANLLTTPDIGSRQIPVGLDREITIMKLLHHPNVVQLYDVWENSNEIYLVMEYVRGGELFHLIQEQRGLSEFDTVRLYRQIIAALLYCHRLSIHHRDLKPENILLDKSTWQVKLVDFGMAALQPLGGYLSTPCGSPHYAAPEVLDRKPRYDGAKSDVWSCGVILYVMLTGSTPFNYTGAGDLAHMFSSIRHADYVMPRMLSSEAQDLIGRILVPNPKDRISMEGVWNHPLLHKYDHRLGRAELQAWIGPKPLIENWNVTCLADVDRDIVNNLRLLWHSVREEELLRKLLSKEANQEKYFYSALVKYRDEQLENYCGPPAVGYSGSDYHHIKTPAAIVAAAPPVPSIRSRTQSQYSILNDEHLRDQSNPSEPPHSAKSYDPYRASKSPLPSAQVPYTNVTVHRRASRSQRGSQRATITGKRKSSTRSGKAASTKSRSSLVNRYSPAPSIASGSVHRVRQRSSSRSSLQRRTRSPSVTRSSSVYPSSPPVIVRSNSSTNHKRRVSFNHSRRSSLSALIPPTVDEDLPSETLPTATKQRSGGGRSPLRYKTKEPMIVGNPPIKAKRGRHTPSQVIAGEARKYSLELGKACEEAFFRSSVASGTSTIPEDQHEGAYETPPSSFSNTMPTAEHVKTTSVRPLPEPPSETPNTYMKRELVAMRERFEAQFGRNDSEVDSSDEGRKYHAVLARLDDMLTGAKSLGMGESHVAGRLPTIDEQHHALGSSVSPSVYNTDPPSSRYYTKRSATDPLSRYDSPYTTSQTPRRHSDQTPIAAKIAHATAAAGSTTIRPVNVPSPHLPLPSPTAVAPLSIRKRTVMGVDLSTTDTTDFARGFGSNHPRPGNDRHNDMSSKEYHVQQPPQAQKPSHGYGQRMEELAKKNMRWFRRNKSPLESEVRYDTTTRDTQGTTIASVAPMTHGTSRFPTPPHSAASSEFPMRPVSQGSEKPHGIVEIDERGNRLKDNFKRLFGRRSSQPCNPEPVQAYQAYHPSYTRTAHQFQTGFVADEAVVSETSLSPSIMHVQRAPQSAGHGSSLPSPMFAPQHGTTHGSPGYQSSWLARILRIPPLVLTCVFNVQRPLARKTLYQLFRSWAIHGMTILSYDRARHAIEARIEKGNALGLKPVTFVVELFVVVDAQAKTSASTAHRGKRPNNGLTPATAQDRHAGLTALRFTQLKGAASSLRRVMEEVERWARMEEWLIEDDGDSGGVSPHGGTKDRDRVGVKVWVREVLGG